MLNVKVFLPTLVVLFKFRYVFTQWDGCNCPPCYYNSYGHTGYPYPYGYSDDYDCAYSQNGYPYGSYMITGYYGNYDHGDTYNVPCDTKQPIIIVVENREKHDELTFDDIISLSMGAVKKLSNDCSCPSWSNCDCCESRNNGRFEFYSECNCSCNGSCQKKCSNKKSSCKSECGYHSSGDCCRNTGNCKHILICEC